MLRGTLTLLNRALRDNARRRRAHFVRLVSVVVLLGMLIEAHVSSGGLGAPGLRLFRSVCYLSVALISLVGLGFFAGAISEEKEDGTLGLLKMADLSTLSIVLGKSTSRLAIALVVFLGQLPFALLSITLGGLALRQVFAAYLAIGAYMVLVANVALLCSVVCRRTSQASLLLLLALMIGLGVAPYLHRSRATLELQQLVPQNNPVLNGVWRACAFFSDNSVLTRIDTILTTGFRESAISPQVWWSLTGALACFIIACLIFDRFTEYVGSTPGGVRGRAFRARTWRWRIRRWPLVWKDFHFLVGGTTFAVAKTVLYLGLMALMIRQADVVWALYGVRLIDAVWLTAGVIATSELLLCATTILRSERVEGTLPCLLVLPRSLAGIVYAKLAGCLLGSLPTVLMCVALIVLFPETGIGDEVLFEQLVPAAMLLLVLLHLTTLYSLIVRWGALPLAVGTLLVLGSCIVPIVVTAVATIYTAGQGPGAAFGPVVYAGLAVSAALQLAIALRLQTVAAQ